MTRYEQEQLERIRQRAEKEKERERELMLSGKLESDSEIVRKKINTRHNIIYLVCPSNPKIPHRDSNKRQTPLIVNFLRANDEIF